MDAISDPMVAAVEDVSSVAEELRGLRDKMKQYGDASKRLNEVSEVIRELAGSVANIRAAFSSAFEQVKLTQMHADTSQKAVEQLVGSIPAIVSRIEASDVTGSVQAFSDSMDKLGAMLHTHEESFGLVVKQFSDARAAQSDAMGALTERVERVLSALTGISADVRGLQDTSSQSFQKLRSISDAVNENLSPKLQSTNQSLDELTGLVKQLNQNTNSVADGMAETASRMIREMTSIRDELGEARKVIGNQESALLRQGELIEILSKQKKSWFS